MQIRSRAIDILSKLGTKAAAAIPDLLELTNDPKYGIQIAARKLLGELEGGESVRKMGAEK